MSRCENCGTDADGLWVGTLEEVDGRLICWPCRQEIDEDSDERAHLSSVEPGFPPAPESLREAALHGPVGELVRAIDPHTEADPAATLIQTLVAFGNACGRGPGFAVESDKHATNEFVGIVGETSKARKGTAWGHVSRTMQHVDNDWAERCIASGIASGEGLIHAVRDPLVIRRKARTKEERGRADEDGRIEEEVDPGIEEKRLLVIQGELAQVLRVMQRPRDVQAPAGEDHRLARHPDRPHHDP